MKWFWERINKKNTGKTAVVCIDYGYWYTAYHKMYRDKPDLAKLRNKLEQQYMIKEFAVFANLENNTLKNEKENLRRMAECIINTVPCVENHNEYMTEFIMLDYIYQYEIENPQTDCYMIFSYNECFSSVIKFLRNRKKEVWVLGVRNTLSTKVKEVANKIIEVPSTEEIQKKYFRMIVQNFAYVSDKPGIIPTFRTTVKSVARYNDESEVKIHIALEEMINIGLVIQRKWEVEPGKTIKVLDADWQKVRAEGL